MGTCCIVYNANLDNQNILITHDKLTSEHPLKENNKRGAKLKAQNQKVNSTPKEKELSTKFSLSKKETNGIDEKENIQESFLFSDYSNIKHTTEKFFNEISDKDNQLLINESIAPIESTNMNSFFVNQDEIEINEYIKNIHIKSEIKKKVEVINNMIRDTSKVELKSNKCNSLKRINKKSLKMKDSDSDTNQKGKKTYARSRMKLLTN